MSGSVIFLCYLNSIRSPMAEGLMRKLHPDWKVASAGLASGELDDLMVAVMREKGVDMDGHVSRTLDQFGHDWDYAIALTEPAGAAAESYFKDTDTVVETWELPDPTKFYYDVRQMMNDYRAVRDNLEMRIQRRFGN